MNETQHEDATIWICHRIVDRVPVADILLEIDEYAYIESISDRKRDALKLFAQARAAAHTTSRPARV